jgi:CelD/BcsL family acetyltransferase involved in cellulose biosynthesis
VAAHSVTRVVGPDTLARLDSLTELCAQVDAPVTATPIWWRAAIESDLAERPMLIVVNRDERPVAVAPLETRTRGRIVDVELLATPFTDQARLPAVDGAAAQALAGEVAAFLAEQPGWRLRLCQLPPDDPVLAALAGHIPLELTAGVPCPTTVLDHGVPLDAQLRRNSRKVLRRCRNRMVREGLDLQMRWLGGAHALRLLPQLQELHRRRDHHQGRASDLDSRAGHGFHTRVLTELLTQGRAEVLWCTVNGHLAAYDIVIRDGEVLRVWDGRIDSRYEPYSLGWLAAVEVLERAHAQSLHVDWMRGEQLSKLRSANGRVECVGAHAWSSPWVRRRTAASARVASGAAALARHLVPPARRAAIRESVLRGRG